MIYQGNIKKMRSEKGIPIVYYLSIGDKEIKINNLIGKKLSIKFLNQIN